MDASDPENRPSEPWLCPSPAPQPRAFARRLLILVAVIGAGLWGLLTLAPPGALGNADRIHMTRMLLVIIVMAATLAASRQRLAVIAAQLAVWLLVIMALVTGYSYRSELAGVAGRLRAELFPGQGQTLDAGTVAFRRGAGGQFWIDGLVDGRPVHFLVDTGASGVVLNRADATRLGFDGSALRFSQHFETANGVTRGAPIQLNELRIGPWRFPNVPASVNEGAMAQSLLGMHLLDQLGSLEISKDTLTLRR